MASGKGHRSHSEGRTEENCSFDLGNASALSESVGSLAPTRVTLGRPVGGSPRWICHLSRRLSLVAGCLFGARCHCNIHPVVLESRGSFASPEVALSLPLSPTSKMIHNKGWNRVAVGACRGILWRRYIMLGACIHV